MTSKIITVLATAATLALAAASPASASYYISRSEAISTARQVVYDRGTWSAVIGGEYYEMTFERTMALWARPKAHTVRRGSRAHAWIVAVADPTQTTCTDVFGGEGIYGTPGVTLDITGSRTPGNWWRTVQSVRCFSD